MQHLVSLLWQDFCSSYHGSPNETSSTAKHESGISPLPTPYFQVSNLAFRFFQYLL